MMPCRNCSSEAGFRFFGTDNERAECSHCGCVWTVEWVKCEKLPAPKLTLIDDGNSHWASVGSIAADILGSMTFPDSVTVRNAE